MKQVVLGVGALVVAGAIWLLFGASDGRVEIGVSDSPAATFAASDHVPEFRGVSFVNPPDPVPASSFDAIKNVNANWTSLIPFGFISNGSSKVKYNIQWQWWGEREAGMRVLMQHAKEKGVKILVKPQIWIGWGTFTGDYQAESEKEWQVMEESYRAFILHYAKLAEEYKAEAFCIGTELKQFVAHRPDFWERLIAEVKAHYSGLLTYAGNWDSYSAFPHWKELDYIGIDAYFPVCDHQTPDRKTMIEGWQKHLKTIHDHQNKVGKPVIFTEYGFRSTDYCGKTPWDSGKGGNVNLEGQKNAYEALYEVFWDQPWFEGGFLWKWYPKHEQAGGAGDNRFTPQNKPAEEVVRNRYGTGS